MFGRLSYSQLLVNLFFCVLNCHSDEERFESFFWGQFLSCRVSGDLEFTSWQSRRLSGLLWNRQWHRSHKQERQGGKTITYVLCAGWEFEENHVNQNLWKWALSERNLSTPRGASPTYPLKPHYWALQKKFVYIPV